MNLVIAAIVLWNTVYLEKAVDYLKQQGMDIPEEYLQQKSPPLLGAYQSHGRLCLEFLLQATSFDKLRPLRVKENKYRSLRLRRLAFSQARTINPFWHGDAIFITKNILFQYLSLLMYFIYL